MDLGRGRRHAPALVHQFPILDSATPSPTVPPPPKDELMESIKSAPSLKSLFEIVSDEERNLQENHLAAIFRSIHTIQNIDR